MKTPYFLHLCNEDVSNDIQSEKLLYLHGEQKLSNSLGIRNIELIGWFDATNNQRAMERTLIRTFNVANRTAGTLKYYNKLNQSEYSIECYLDSMPEVRFDESDKKVHFVINLVAYDPFWKGQGITANISSITKLGEFPLYIPPEGFSFGYKSDNLETVYENIGDTEIGATYRLTANGGDVTNPQIRHVQKNETLRITYFLKDGDYIDVISMPDYVNIIINGSKNGMIYLLDAGKRSFFLVDFGLNTIAYEADVNSTFLDVAIIYQDSYLTVD